MNEQKYKGLAIAGFVLSLIGLVIFPLLGLLGIIFGSFALGANKNSVCKYANEALRFGKASLWIGIVDVIWAIGAIVWIIFSLIN